MLPEKKVENQIKRYLESIGAYYIKTLGGSVPAGTPDILACYRGQFIAIEVKRPDKGKVSELQKQKIKQITQAGGLAFTASSLAEVVERIGGL